MKLLAISDTYLPADLMRRELAVLKDVGVDVEVRHWGHETLIDLQEDNLEIETKGPDAVPLSNDITADLGGVGIIVVQFAPVSRAFIEKAEDLRLIGVMRAGAENIAVDLATQRHISVMNTPGRNARAVAECTMGMILAEIRNIARSHAKLKSKVWTRSFPNSDAIPELHEKTVGLVGYGAVGRLVCGYLRAFGSNVIAFDPYFKGDPAPAKLVSLEELLTQSDIVSIHARLTEESLHLIGEKELAMMKPTAVLVNTARSGLVDERALIEALRAKRITGAAVDVFDEEPLPPDHPFIELGNVTITAHLAGSTKDAFKNSARLMAGHVCNAISGVEDIPVINGVRPALDVG
ncbi:MAG: 2-hydroxyacid dehydrogenase [Candidatus Zixiibacteriota bacterium]|nr:MAG: 2-hydroxyacid dehydrogenase [candidate division Zixibacteria bacterium]